MFSIGVFKLSIGFKLNGWLMVLHHLSILFKGMLNLGAEMLVFSSSFILILQLWVAVVMVILALFGQSIDCQLSVVVRGCMEVQGTFMLEFHVDGLIVSCGCF